MFRDIFDVLVMVASVLQIIGVILFSFSARSAEYARPRATHHGSRCNPARSADDEAKV